MTVMRRQITITVEEDVEEDVLSVYVEVAEGLSTMEAVGLMEIAMQQHLRSKHTEGPTVYLSNQE